MMNIQQLYLLSSKKKMLNSFMYSTRILLLTSLSVDVKYSFATTMKNAALNTIMGTRNCICNSYHADLPDLSVPVHSWFRSTGSKSKEKSSRRSSCCTDTGSGCQQLLYRKLTIHELIAVIAAAIAASEGTSTDGFVVRSIRKINRKKR